MDKISIIIPVYNVEPYINKCLVSIMAQTHKNLEILLIDDGSTDCSGKICDEYAVKDNRIRVFHRANGGVSSAKNFGLDNFTGRYVGFVDPDDYIEPDMYEVLYKKIKSRGVQIGVANYFKDYDAESLAMCNRKHISDEEIIPAKSMLLYMLKRDYHMGFCGYVWNKLFLSDNILKYGLRFDESINYGEDVLFYTTFVLASGCSGVYTDSPLYHYYQRDTAISKSKSLAVRLDILSAYEKVNELMEYNGYTDDSFWARGFYCYHASVIAEIALQNSDEKTLHLMQRKIKNYLEDYIETNKEFPEKIKRMHGLLEVKIT